MKIEVVTPEESMGDVISDLNKRRVGRGHGDSPFRRTCRKGKGPAS